MKPTIKAVHLTCSVSRHAGGMFESIRHLSHSITQSPHVRLSVVGVRDENTDEDLHEWAPLDVTIYSILGPERLGFAPGMWRNLRSSDIDILHLHGIWSYPSVLVGRWGLQTGRPYMVSPHGMLEPWALRQSKFRKAVVSFLYQDTCLRGAAVLRATSQMEVESIRAAGFSNRIALIPNGVEILDRLPSPSAPVPGRKRRMLFMSRIHPKKGLLNLVEAWRRLSLEQGAGSRGQGASPHPGPLPIGWGEGGVSPGGGTGVPASAPGVSGPAPGSPVADWEIHIVGPDEKGHKAEVMAAVKKAGLEAQIHFPPEVWGPERMALYLDSDVFVLPSYSENFGLVIAEALGCGIPVITTKATPWDDLVSHRCGWWIDVGVEPLVRVLREVLPSPPEALREMGRRGRSLIEQKYTWGPIGRQMVETYEWMLDRGPRPGYVID